LIVLDTTVLIYAAGTEHPLKAPCERALEAVATGAIRATTIAGVLQEFASVWARRRPRKDASARALDYLAMLAPLQRVDEQDLEAGLRLYERHTDLGSFDAVLAAVALERNAQALVSADRAFAAVRGLPYVNPASPELDELLGG
jgi:predicted nucleic acid-binding protein